MSHHKQPGAQASSEPRRPLRADFTARTMRHASVAKARRVRKQQLQVTIKEFFSMKSLNFLRTVPGAALSLAVVATGSVGVYALSNWFNGHVTVRENDSVLSVDLSSCKGGLPSGVDNPDRSNVQFKILGNPHISAADLENQLLAECELDAVYDFYTTKGQADGQFVPAIVKTANDKSVTFTYMRGGEKREKTLAITSAAIYKEGAAAAKSDLHAGTPVVIVAKQPANWQEDKDQLDEIKDAQSIFITQHDINLAPSATKKGFYEESNILPLDHYKKIHP